MKKLIYILILFPITIFAQNWHSEERTYEYDNLNRLVKVVFHNGIVYNYTYDNLGNRLSKIVDVQLPFDNFELSTVGLTCINSSDGIIHIEADRRNFYNVEITSPENDFNDTFTIEFINDWELHLNNLEGGEYFIDITINGISEDLYKKSFIIILDEPEPLEASSRMASDASNFTVEMSTGTAPFTIKLNSEIIGTTNESEFTFIANHGDIVEVSTAKACEGKYIETLSVIEGVSMYPNPTSDKVFFIIPSIESNNSIEIELFDINARLIESFYPNVSNSKVEISLQHLPNGLYLIKFPSLGEKTFKILKE